MMNPTPEQVRDGLTSDRLAKMRDDALRATDDGRWGAWGMVLVTGPDYDVDNARELAGFRAVDGELRTFNLDHVVNFQPKTAVALVDEVLALREAAHDLADALRLTQEFVGPDTLPAIEGWSWYDALARHAPEMLPGGERSLTLGPPPRGIPLTGALPDEDPEREAQYIANRTGSPVFYPGADEWVIVHPAGGHETGYRAPAPRRPWWKFWVR